MTDWTEVQTNGLETYLTAPLLKSLRERGRAATGEDPADSLLAAAIARVRSEIRSGRRTPLSARLSTVPPECVPVVSLLTLTGLRNRFPEVKTSSDTEEQIAAARRLLERIGTGKVDLTPPSDPIHTASFAQTQTLRKRKNPLSARNLRGF